MFAGGLRPSTPPLVTGLVKPLRSHCGHLLKASVTCINKHKRCCYLPCSLSIVYNELRDIFVCIATHFLAVFIACKFAFCFYS